MAFCVQGVAPIDHTVAVAGPLAGSVLDVALMCAFQGCMRASQGPPPLPPPPLPLPPLLQPLLLP